MSDNKSDIFWDLPAAFVLLTRLPLPALPDAAFAGAARAVWAYPVVGLVLGGVAAALGAGLTALGLPPLLVAGGVLVALVMLTGAMHEDGLADTADGLWGGLTPARRLDIMKDSRIGTYGVLALVLAMGLRWQGYALVSWAELICALVLSRAAMPPLMLALPHARADGLSKRVGKPGMPPVAAAGAIAVVVALVLTGGSGLVALALAAGTATGMAALARRKIGGQTGDILGATQMVVEIAVLLTFVAL
ncbi:adenosylcobinamide-GDP ribazoletransferase [uncultured Tateyamaria sp.]|uniref:adenosylcobinamide-GDP ribazoletransferase n=1 Tax=Tateyamaria sp. 1078 TaxID=3417464 RepID=UPI0026121FD0|nr:adenosylcobinamide-GDP ribazoletransferase [uncultured Tateyamaria sp.]